MHESPYPVNVMFPKSRITKAKQLIMYILAVRNSQQYRISTLIPLYLSEQIVVAHANYVNYQG